ncbi:MAG: hypothetical protein N2690_07345 [Rhodocyclaceae bacterium]|uniref:HNH endonuclease n=2 Tax=Tepidimonas charontis TaxID=2267262 RepID=A0A554X2X7_9BURK|nr:hypothetical protein [Rhodocyclaceae bacterium]TSE30200.1 hypothetical protein Tchar_02473 [Tepidimonas charontis]
MKTRVIDMTGSRAGRVTVLAFAGTKGKNAYWSCVCDCGTRFVTQGRHLRSGSTKSCGCFGKEQRALATSKAKTKHGKTAGGNSRVYRIWSNMVSRCTNPNFDAYPYYGGRGISVCDRWRLFENFLQDMGEPGPDESIDRIDPSGDYEPGNCRWSSKIEQANNTRKNKVLEIDGTRMTVAEWSRQPGACAAKTIYERLERGWDSRRAVFAPLRRAA